ncbi:MAG: outer membrane protein assembly factor BamD [Xanthomonadales bacterium]|nr:outer membrane protein assembly factor BamD [Xanthomonadales bacterium]
MTPSLSRLNQHIRTLGLLLLTLFLFACGSKSDLHEGRSADELYLEAKAAVTKGNYSKAAQMFSQLQTRYPFGRYTEQAQLEMAFAQYRLEQPDQAIATLDRFVKTYPAHPNIDYALYLKGLVNFEENYGFLSKIFPSRVRDRDQTIARQSFNDFNELLRRFPDSQYTPDARQRMVYLKNNLAGYEIEVAQYYMRRTAYIAAANRARYVLETYPGTPDTSVALQILHQAYTALEMQELADSSLRVLAMNFPDDPYVTGQSQKKTWLSYLWPFD